MLKKFPHKLLPTEKNHAQPNGEQKFHESKKIAQPPSPPPQKKNNGPSLRVNLYLLQGFFEEIEDLKYALQQAARLNSAYEKALKQLCSQSGVAFPKITTTTPKKRSRKRTRSQAREFTGR